jgi:phosphatidate cytidylyltransferase
VLRTRLLTAIVLIPIVIWLIYLGGLPFLALVAGLTTLAEIEFCLLIARAEFRPVHLFGIALVWLFLLDGQFVERNLLRPGLTAVLSLSLVWQIARRRYSKLRDWTEMVASGVYVGLYGSYLIRLRGLPGDGLWWALIAIPVILLADSAAYFIGSAWGKHKLAPSLSFGKTWEGYTSGILVAGAAGAFLAWLWTFRTAPGSSVTASRGLSLGVLIGTLAPIGDLVVSMIKREAGVDDSGKMLPGHGGALDRLDSVLWTAAIAYYYAAQFAA